LKDEVLAAYLRDTANAHLLQADGTYSRPGEAEQRFDSQSWFFGRSLKGLELRQG
jgi:hypothetical protein